MGSSRRKRALLDIIPFVPIGQGYTPVPSEPRRYTNTIIPSKSCQPHCQARFSSFWLTYARPIASYPNSCKAWIRANYKLAIVVVGFAAVAVAVALATFRQSSPFRAQPIAPPWPTLGVPQTPTVTDPNAIVPQDRCPGYTLSNVQKFPRGLNGFLALNGAPCNSYGKDYPELLLSVYYDTETRLHVTIEDINGTQYRIPESLVSIPMPSEGIDAVQYSFNYNEAPFEFWITRNDGDILFDTRGYKLIFETQYIEITTNMEEGYNVYGLGEVIHSLKLDTNLTLTMWAKYVQPSCSANVSDEPDPIDANVYGSHPVYFQHKYGRFGGRNHSTHAVYLRNTNGMDILLRKNTLQYRVIGGIFDLYFYTGPSPKDVLRQYVSSIGLPAMHQYWTLGFHQCRWGYRDVNDLESVIRGYRDSNVPLETIWTDIDCTFLDEYYLT